jgi:hypothetical protein
VASGHTPFTVNSGTKVVNLNADKLDGIDSTGFVNTSSFRTVGPVTTTPTQTPDSVTLATIGNLTFTGQCTPYVPLISDNRVELFISSAAANTAYADVTQSFAGGTFGSGAMPAGTPEHLADWNTHSNRTPDFNPVTGSAVEANGHQVTFDLYQGINDRSNPNECIFGGTFAVK